MITGARHLIVNADDFGLSAGVNRGIVEAYDNGIVTSASLMVHKPAAAQAAALARSRPSLGLGLHIDIGVVGRAVEWWRATGIGHVGLRTADRTAATPVARLATLLRTSRSDASAIRSFPGPAPW